MDPHLHSVDAGLLPNLWNRPAGDTPKLTALLRTRIPAVAVARLGALARAEGTDLSTALAVAFRVLVYRYTGHEALPGDSRASGARELCDIDALPRPDASFRTLLTAQRGSRERRGNESPSPRDAMPALLALQDDAVPDAGVPRAPDGCELALRLRRRSGALLATWWYSAEHISRAAVHRVAESFAALLRGVVRAPDRPICRLPLVSARERRRLIAAGHGGTLALPKRGDVLALFGREVRRRPHAAALLCGDAVLNYEDVDRRSAQAASLLRKSDAGRAATVGLAVRPGPALTIGLLGIWRAGATAVLLDPTDPAERLRAIVRNAGVSHAWTDAEHAPRIAELGLTPVLAEDAPRIAPAARDVSPAPRGIAYVVHTSGTTGTPKGVPITHRQLFNFLCTIQHDYELCDDDVLLALARPAFGIIIFEALLPLTVGAAIRFLPPGRGFDVERICDDLRRATTLHAVPATLAVILDALRTRQARGERYDHLRRVFVGGDRVVPSLLRELTSVLPHARTFAQYGCTEATHLSLRHAVSPHRLSERTIVGRPFANGCARVADDCGGVLPVGVTGEILLGGASVTKGYLGRAEPTHDRFLRIGKERYYRTGDLGRYLPNGDVEFVGRRDEQVKVRGMRVELGEIESALAAHSSLAQAAVLCAEGRAGAQLVACCVPAVGASVDEAALRGFLAGRVPDYMVPSRFVSLDELPVNANRKLDRRALAGIVARASSEAAADAPATGLERAVAEIWKQVLGLDRIARSDNFLSLGGDSLKATLVTNRIQDLLGGEIVHVVALLDAPTLASLAGYLEQHCAAAVARLFGGPDPARGPESRSRVDATRIEALRAVIPQPATSEPAAARNPQAIFVLSPPRSGSTLLRVVLGGHPRLFAPPELDLLSFATLQERKATLAGKYYFWLEGTVRALMAIEHCSADEAREIMDDCERRGLTTQEFYALLQRWLGERILVDKTPYYGLSPAILNRAERDFADPLYIHLVRHPCAMVRSFEEGRFDLVFFSKNHVAPSFPRRELGEMVWTLTHRNILAFLGSVPAARHLRVHYEDLVRAPRATVERLCDFIGVPLHEAMLDPYADAKARMTDGIHPASKMLGDVKFHGHRAIDPDAADRWRGADAAEALGEPAAELARVFGYPPASAGTPGRE